MLVFGGVIKLYLALPPDVQFHTSNIFTWKDRQSDSFTPSTLVASSWVATAKNTLKHTPSSTAFKGNLFLQYTFPDSCCLLSQKDDRLCQSPTATFHSGWFSGISTTKNSKKIPLVTAYCHPYVLCTYIYIYIKFFNTYLVVFLQVQCHPPDNC